MVRAAAERTTRWHEAAQRIRWNVRPFIDGRYVESRAAERIANINPASEATLCEFGAGTAADIDAAVTVARQRFEQGGWSALSPPRRGEVLARLAELIVRENEHLALLDTLEMGKPIQAALVDTARFGPSLLQSWAALADKLLGGSAPLAPGSLSFNVYEPHGVVGAIAPWNFPLVNAIFKVGR